MKKNTPAERLINGILLENPTLVLTLGMCPTLAVTTSAINGLGMGLTTTAVLMFSNMIISLLRNFIPDRVRIPSYIVVIASLVTIVQFVLQAYVPTLNEALGVYIPLIVVNCIILGRAESYAGKNGPISSFFDGLGMGLGFTGALTILGALRELLGAGTFFNIQILPESVYTPITIFILAPGAFLVLSCMVAVQNRIKNNPPKKAAAKEEAAAEEAAIEAKEDTSVKALEDKGAPAADLIKEAQKAKEAKVAVESKAAEAVKDVKESKAAEADKGAEETKEAPKTAEAKKAEESKEAKEASEAKAAPEEKEIKDSETTEEDRTFKYGNKVPVEEKKKGKKAKDFKEAHSANKGKRKKKPQKARNNNNPGPKKPNVKKKSKDAKKEGGES